jgi:hypothetical protein
MMSSVKTKVGRRLGKARLADGIAGVTWLHAMIDEHIDRDADPIKGVLRIGTISTRGCRRWSPPATSVSINPDPGCLIAGTERSSGGRQLAQPGRWSPLVDHLFFVGTVLIAVAVTGVCLLYQDVGPWWRTAFRTSTRTSGVARASR